MKFFKSYSLFHKIFFIVFLILNIIVFIAPAFQQGGSWNSVFSFLSILGFVVTISGLFAGIIR